MRLLILLAVATVLAGAALGQTRPADQPTSAAPGQTQWGTSKAGVQLSLTVTDATAAGKKLAFTSAVRNVATSAVKLPPAKEVFGWVMVVYGRENAWITAKVFPAAGLTAWPEALEGGKTIQFAPADAAGLDVYPYDKRQEVYKAYLQPLEAGALPKAEGKLADKLAPGKARVVLTLCLPRPGESPLLLASNAVDIDLSVAAAGGGWAALPADVRKQQADKLIAKFDKDAWAGMAAHGEAVAIGPPIVPYLAEALGDLRRPDFSRLWLATALADIRCPAAADEMIRLLDDPTAGVRGVVAYHGPKQHSDKLDAAILAKVATGQDGAVLSYALLGFLVQRNQVPPALLAASLDSKDPKVRSAVISALKTQASDDNLTRLVRLLSDENEQVRSAAARALGAMGRPEGPVVGALVRAIQSPGESARQSIAEALGTLTGRKAPYDPKADAAAKEKVLKDWQAWWAKSGGKAAKNEQ
jgi:HEAT repeat protein